MKEYILFLENQISKCLNDINLQREHWAFCQALNKFKELEFQQKNTLKNTPNESIFEEKRQQIINDKIWQGNVSRVINANSFQEIEKLLNLFFDELKATENWQGRSNEEIKRHFVFWAKKQKSQQKNITNAKPTTKNHIERLSLFAEQYENK